MQRNKYLSYSIRLMYTPAIIHLPNIHQLLASRPRNLIWQALVRQRLPRRLDNVHLIARAGRLGCEILKACGAREFEDEVLGAESEACAYIISYLFEDLFAGWERHSLPGGRANSCTFVAPTFRSRLPNVVLFS